MTPHDARLDAFAECDESTDKHNTEQADDAALTSKKCPSKASKKKSPFYAPLPPRAINDQRLTASHLRLLAAVAMHDRMSGARGVGQGCWASNERLANETGLNYRNVSTAMNDLARLGYLDYRKHPMDGRRKTWIVIYGTPEDTAFVKGPDSSPTDEASTSDSSPRDEKYFAHQNQSSNNYNDIASVRDTRDTVKRRRDSAEAAAIKGSSVENVGATLAQLERALKAGEAIDLDTAVQYLTKLDDELDRTDPNHGRAGRLLEDVRYVIDEEQAQ